MSCMHPGGFAVTTGWLVHVFCSSCHGWLAVELDHGALASIAQRRRADRLLGGRYETPITVDGVTRSLSEWAARLEVDPAVIYHRLQGRKWSVRDAVLSPYGTRLSRQERGS